LKTSLYIRKASEFRESYSRFASKVKWYSSLIFFLGAEFTQAYASQYGSGVVPADNAQPIGASPEGEKRWTIATARESERHTTVGQGAVPATQDSRSRQKFPDS